MDMLESVENIPWPGEALVHLHSSQLANKARHVLISPSPSFVGRTTTSSSSSSSSSLQTRSSHLALVICGRAQTQAADRRYAAASSGPLANCWMMYVIEDHDEAILLSLESAGQSDYQSGHVRRCNAVPWTRRALK
jgi:hypothetical protein